MQLRQQCYCVKITFLLLLCTRPVVHISRKHIVCSVLVQGGHSRWAWLRWPTSRCYLWHLWTVTNDSKHIQASFSLIPTDWICLRVAQMPRSQDLAIFVTTDGQTDQLLYPCACTWGKYAVLVHACKINSDALSMVMCTINAVNILSVDPYIS